MAGSDRRGFLKDLLRAAAETAQEVRGAIESFDVNDLTGGTEPWQEPWQPDSPPAPGRPTTRAAGLEDLERLCEEVGLVARAADMRRLARRGLRLTRREVDGEVEVGGSRLGGAPDVPAGFEWPRWEDVELAFLGQVSLADVAALDPETPLPRDGLLLFFYAADRLPDGLRPSHRGSARALVVTGPLERLEHPGPRLGEQPLELSVELQVPGAWSSPAEPLELDMDEAAAWEQLRERLAQLQGVELDELTEGWQALHRLGGYPDELRGEMALDCQLASNGIDLAEGEGYLDERRETLDAGARDWRLLLQLSDDEALGTSWGEGFSRLYLWVKDEELDSAWAIVQ